MDYEQLRQIPEFPQRKDSIIDQLYDLRVIAEKLGMVSASAVIMKIIMKNSIVKRRKNE